MSISTEAAKRKKRLNKARKAKSVPVRRSGAAAEKRSVAREIGATRKNTFKADFLKIGR